MPKVSDLTVVPAGMNLTYCKLWR